MGRRIIALILALFLPISSFASINIDGAILEMSAPGVIKGKEMTTIHGGGIRFRIQDETLRPFSVIPPSVRSGCGGIDATFGAFSYLNMEYLGQFLQGLVQGLPVVFFNLALHTFCPSCQQLFQQLTSLANQINQIGVNKCAAINLATAWGKQMIDKAFNRNKDGDRFYGERDPAQFFDGFIRKIGEYAEKFSRDLNYYCPGGNCLMGILLNVNKQPTTLMDMMVQGGEVPPAVGALLGVDNATLAKLFRAIFGDIALFPAEKKQEERTVLSHSIIPYTGYSLDGVRFLLGIENSSSGKICDKNGQVRMSVIAFTGDKNNTWRTEDITLSPLCGKVSQYTENIKRKILSRQALSDDEVKLLASLPAPVLYLLNAGSVEQGLIDAIFKDIDIYITSELAYSILSRIQQKYAGWLARCVADAKGKDQDAHKVCSDAMKSLGEISRSLYEVRMNYYRQLSENFQTYSVAYSIHSRIMAQIASSPLYGTLFYSRMLSIAEGRPRQAGGQ